MRLLVSWIISVFVIEGISLRLTEFSYAARPLQKRIQELVCMVGSDGERVAFALTTSAKPSMRESFHLDAWQVAMHLGRRTVNGYSGTGPEILNPFLLAPTAEVLDRVLLSARVPEKSVGVFDLEGHRFTHSRLPSREPGAYEWGDTILFSSNGTSDEYIDTGFTAVGDEWRWTDGKNARLKFNIRPTATACRLRFTAVPFLPKRVSRQRVIVSVGDQVVQTFAMNDSGSKEYSVELPKSLMRRIGSSLTMQFDLPDAVAPAAVGVHEDARALGIAISRMSIEPVTDRADPRFYRWGTVLDLGSPQTNQFVSRGFDMQPDGWRWTVAKQAQLRFRVAPTARQRCLHMEAAAFVPPSVPRQRVVLSVNDGPAHNIIFANTWATTARLCVNSELLDAQELIVNLEMLDAVSPASAGVNSDTRPFGIALRQFRME
jgi:hypothetical protein